jgi:hypothetical protein
VKSSAVLVFPTFPLEHVPPAEMDVIRRFLFQTMQGVDEDHTRRWRRMWKRVGDGEVMQMYPVVGRHGAFHKRHMTLEARIFEHQDGFVPNKAGQRAFRNWLKVGASLVSLELHEGEAKFLPGSLSYEDASDDEMREFHEAAMDFLRTPRALRRLWPAVKPAQRLEMLELVLRNPNEEQPA